MSQDDDEIVIELMECQQPTETDTEREFVEDLYDRLNRRCHRNDGPLRFEDLYFDMFSCGTKPFWFLPYSHEYARMLRENGYNPAVILSGKSEAGQVEMYEDEVVKMTIDTVWGWMGKYGKAHREENGREQP